MKRLVLPAVLMALLAACTQPAAAPGASPTPGASPAAGASSSPTPGAGPAADAIPTTGDAVMLEVDGKEVRVDPARKRGGGSSGTVVDFGFADTSAKPLEPEEWTFHLNAFLKSEYTGFDWKVEDLTEPTVSLYRGTDQVDAVLETRRQFHYISPRDLEMGDPGFVVTKAGDQLTVRYAGEMLLDGLAPDDVPKKIQVDGWLTMKVRR